MSHDALVRKLTDAVARVRNTPASHVHILFVSATEARNEFAGVLEKALVKGPVVIEKQSAPKAVLIAIDELDAMLGHPSRPLDALTAEFDSLLARMQTPGSRKGMKAAFDASPEALGRAALAGAKRARAKRKKRG